MFSKNYGCFSESVHIAFTVICFIGIIFGFLAFFAGIFAAFKFGVLAIVNSSFIGLFLMWGSLLSLILLTRNWKPKCLSEGAGSSIIDKASISDENSVKQSIAVKTKTITKKLKNNK